MAAGQGFKTFTTGEVLTAGDVNGYLMQGINVFTNSTARDAAITAPAEGQFAFTKDNNSLWYYDGAAWVASGATGDIEGVTAGVGISGGGTSGTITITNDMATTITAAGDIVIGTGSGTYDNLPIGTTNQVLTADTTVSPYKIKWASAAATGSNFTLLNTGGTALTGAQEVTVSGISGADKIFVVVNSASAANASSQIGIRLNGATTNYSANLIDMEWTVTYSNANYDTTATTPTSLPLAIINSTAAGLATGSALITGANSSGVKVCQVFGGGASMGAQGGQRNRMGQHLYTGTSTISSISVTSSSGNLDAGTVYVYTSA